MASADRACSQSAETFSSRELRELHRLDTHTPLLPSFFDEIPRVLDYHPMRKLTKVELLKRFHSGQRKLLLAEIAFISAHVDRADQPLKMLYPGAGPGDHIPVLLEIFPNLHIIGFDPFGFTPELGVHPHFKGFCTLFTDEVAASYTGGVDFLVSDIRRRTTGSDSEREDMILEDMELQARWVRIVRPRAALLKMRLPWREDLSKDSFYEYLSGRIHVQQYAPLFSSEGRLWVERPPGDDPYPVKMYSLKAHDDASFYYNVFAREHINYFKGSDFDAEILRRLRALEVGPEGDKERFTSGADTAGEIRVWRDYLALPGASHVSAADMVSRYPIGLGHARRLVHKKISKKDQTKFDCLWKGKKQKHARRRITSQSGRASGIPPPSSEPSHS